MINKIFLGFFSATLAFSVFAQSDSNTQNLRDRVEQRDASRGDKITKRDLRETARDTPGLASLPAGPKLTACPGEFAFCGSSTCKPTGKKIAVNVGGDNRTKDYPEAVCECPIITKEIADKNGIALEGFDFGNSPYDYMTDKIKGQTVVISTTNGTQAIESARHADKEIGRAHV